MKTAFFKFVFVFLTVFLAFVAAIEYEDYKNSHALLITRDILSSDTREPSGDFTIRKDENLLFRPRGIHLYMIPVTDKMDEEGFWIERLQGNDSEIQEGESFYTDFKLFDEPLLERHYLIVCTPEKLEKYDEIYEEIVSSYYTNNVVAIFENHQPKFTILECR